MLDHAGELNQKITITKKDVTVDAEGNREPVESVVCTCWARVKDSTTREFYEADSRGMKYVVNFTIRYRRGLNDGMTVWLDGDAYEIREINQGIHRRDYILLRTSRKVGM